MLERTHNKPKEVEFTEEQKSIFKKNSRYLSQDSILYFVIIYV
jgi:hypothetical protein